MAAWWLITTYSVFVLVCLLWAVQEGRMYAEFGKMWASVRHRWAGEHRFTAACVLFVTALGGWPGTVLLLIVVFVFLRSSKGYRVQAQQALDLKTELLGNARYWEDLAKSAGQTPETRSAAQQTAQARKAAAAAVVIPKLPS